MEHLIYFIYFFQLKSCQLIIGLLQRACQSLICGETVLSLEVGQDAATISLVSTKHQHVVTLLRRSFGRVFPEELLVITEGSCRAGECRSDFETFEYCSVGEEGEERGQEEGGRIVRIELHDFQSDIECHSLVLAGYDHGCKYFLQFAFQSD